jgi:hypothetical protein
VSRGIRDTRSYWEIPVSSKEGRESRSRQGMFSDSRSGLRKCKKREEEGLDRKN